MKEKEELDKQEQQLNTEIVLLQSSLNTFNALNQRLHGQKTRGNLTPAEYSQETGHLEQVRRSKKLVSFGY